MQNIFSKRLRNDESFALTSDDSFPLASAANAASALTMKRSFDTAPVFEATSAALEPTSSPSRLICDPMFAQLDDPLFTENGFELSPLSYDETSEWFLNEPPKINGEPFSDEVVGCAVVKPSNGYFLRPTKDAYNTEVVDVNSFIRNPVVTVAHMDTGPLSPSPMADVKVEVKSEYVDESPEVTHNSEVPFNSMESKVVKRGRPMKITSRSKQALYAREYRRKNKQALWDYERRVKEQDDEIMRLRNQNKRMQEKLSKLICMKDAITKQCCAPIQDDDHALNITLAEIRSHPSTKQLLRSTGRDAFCVHVNGDSFSVLSCEACNAQKTKLHEHIAEERRNGNLELFNGDFESIKDFIR